MAEQALLRIRRNIVVHRLGVMRAMKWRWGRVAGIIVPVYQVQHPTRPQMFP